MYIHVMIKLLNRYECKDQLKNLIKKNRKTSNYECDKNTYLYKKFAFGNSYFKNVHLKYQIFKM